MRRVLFIKGMHQLLKRQCIYLFVLVILTQGKMCFHTLHKLPGNHLHCLHNRFVNLFYLFSNHFTKQVYNHLFLVDQKNLHRLFVRHTVGKPVAQRPSGSKVLPAVMPAHTVSFQTKQIIQRLYHGLFQ